MPMTLARIEAGTDETLQAAQPVGREPDKLQMEQPMTINNEQAVSDAVQRAADAWDAHCLAVERCNAAIPDVMASKAERQVYDERYRASEQAKRAMYAAAFDLAKWASENRAALAASHPLEQQQAVSGDAVERVTPEMQAAWVAYDPPGQFKETMSFARFNGQMRCAFMSGYSAALTASGVERMREALEAVEGAMLRGDDGAIGDFGWNITKLNKARPLIRTALQEEGVERRD